MRVGLHIVIFQPGQQEQRQERAPDFPEDAGSARMGQENLGAADPIFQWGGRPENAKLRKLGAAAEQAGAGAVFQSHDIPAGKSGVIFDRIAQQESSREIPQAAARDFPPHPPDVAIIANAFDPIIKIQVQGVNGREMLEVDGARHQRVVMDKERRLSKQMSFRLRQTGRVRNRTGRLLPRVNPDMPELLRDGIRVQPRVRDLAFEAWNLLEPAAGVILPAVEITAQPLAADRPIAEVGPHVSAKSVDRRQFPGLRSKDRNALRAQCGRTNLPLLESARAKQGVPRLRENAGAIEHAPLARGLR